MLPALSFLMPVSELVRRRYSCRTFSEREIEPEKKALLDDLLGQLTAAAQPRMRFGWIDKRELQAENIFTSGTYGMIKGNRFFVAGIVRRGGAAIWEDLGTSLEAIVLKLTEWGLNSCWIGGVFDRKRFGRHLGLSADEGLPVVIAVGYAAGSTSLRDRLVRWSAGGDRRRPWHHLFFHESLKRPLAEGDLAKYREALENVRLAPSASNKQPWRIFYLPPYLHFYLDRDRFYSRLIAAADLQRIDLGIARAHFGFSVAAAALAGEWLGLDPGLADLPPSFTYMFSFRSGSAA